MQILIQNIQSRAQDFAFLTSSKIMSMLLVQGPRFEQQKKKKVLLRHFSCVQLCTLCNTIDCVPHQPPLSMRFFRQEYWSGLLCPPPRDLPNPGIKPTSLMSPGLAGGFFTTSATWEAHTYMYYVCNCMYIYIYICNNYIYKCIKSQSRLLLNRLCSSYLIVCRTQTCSQRGRERVNAFQCSLLRI